VEEEVYNQSDVRPLAQRGSSSLQGTAHLCNQLPGLFEKYSIKSMFDAGANDAAWQQDTLAHMVEYHAGERNSNIVELAKKRNPDISICVHDITQDPLPGVDLLFIRDVAIHLNNHYKKLMIKNWLASQIPWLLTTQLNYCKHNKDFEQVPGEWHFAEINWNLEPWNFPEPYERVEDLSGLEQRTPSQPVERFMCLWHRNQIVDLV